MPESAARTLSADALSHTSALFAALIRRITSTESDPRALRPGDTCLVGIPETLVRVIDVGRYDPPADIGWLPRPHTLLTVLPVDHPSEMQQGDEDEGDTIELDSAAPITLEVVSQS